MKKFFFTSPVILFALYNLPSYCAKDYRNAEAVAVTVIGTGYVGLVSGACLAEKGNTVICYDIDKEKIEKLKNGLIPIYEPGLEEIVARNVHTGRLSFTHDEEHALRSAKIVFIAVGTPMSPDGKADLSAVKKSLDTIKNYLSAKKIICIKSTVPAGTCDWASSYLIEQGVDKGYFDIVSNPEFLREGSAIQDFLKPDRIVIGSNTEYAADAIAYLYREIVEEHIPIIKTSLVSSETIKYASNAFLACKLSFVNEIANFCEKTGAHIADVIYGMGLDKRIGLSFLKPGPGFGGSCFPKDCNELVCTGHKYGLLFHMIDTALKVNELQKRKAVEKLQELVGPLAGKRIAILGLAFKANTDDVRYSPAITTIEMLLEQGAQVVAYDPVAIGPMKKIFPHIIYAETAYKAIEHADGLLILTEWDEFKHLNLEIIGQSMNEKVLVDMRNILDYEMLDELDFAYAGIGIKQI